MKSEVHIQTSLRDKITYLEKAFCTTPLKVANVTEDKKDPALRLMLMSSSPGILDGDEYHIRIDINSGASLLLSTQSYQRLFNMRTGASQKMEVYVNNGFFCFLPHPVVPHKASEFVSNNRIFLSGKCKLIWGEVLTCGRKLTGEAFHFTGYRAVTEVFLNNKIIIKENVFIQPSVTDVSVIGQLEGYTHQATLIYLDEEAETTELIKVIKVFLSLQHNIEFGITKAQQNGLIIRLVGHKAEQLFESLQLISTKFLDASLTVASSA